MESKLTLQGLYDKRDGLRVRIRKEHHNKLLRHRRWMLLNPDSEGQLLIKIDCNEIVHFLQSTPLQFPENLNQLRGEAYKQFLEKLETFKQHINNLTIYATSSRFEHIFQYFDEPFLNVLLQLAERLYCLRTTNEQVAEHVTKMFNGLVWSLCNYIGSGRELVSSRYLELLLEALKNPSQTMKGNILSSLGSLSEHSHFLELMMNAGLFNIVLEGNLPKDSVVYFFMKTLENIGLEQYKPYVKDIMKLLTEELYRSTSVKNIKNVFQTYGFILSTHNISQCPEIVLDSKKEVEAIQNWLLQSREFNTSQDQRSFSKYFPNTLELIDSIYTVDVQVLQDEYTDFLRDKMLQGTVELLNGCLVSTDVLVRDKANRILENICADELLAEEVFDEYPNLIAHMFATMTPEGSLNETFNVKKSCLIGLCNLCIVGHESNVTRILIKRGILQLFSEKLRDYQDAEYNLKILQALEVIFEIGYFEQKERELFSNRMVVMFQSAGGQIPLTKLFEHNNEQVSKKAMHLHDFYFSRTEADKLEEDDP